MRFALLGDHPDGVQLARALVRTGRHQLVAYTGPRAGLERLRDLGLSPQPIGDLEEVLADPAIEAVVVASGLTHRPGQLRRALQAERHVLCAYPADEGPDTAYEAALIQGDTHGLLLPLLPDTLHPAVTRLADLLSGRESPLGTLQLIEMRQATAPTGVPGWDLLRALGGDIAEVSAFAAGEEWAADVPVLVAGRFERGGLFQVTLLPGLPETAWHLGITGSHGGAELAFPEGRSGPAQLRWYDAAGNLQQATWDTWDPWMALAGVFEEALAQQGTRPDAANAEPRGAAPGGGLTWQDAVRCQELDDAARRSLARRRASTLEYPEATEEVGFKGTMTLVGCGVLWVSLLLLILARWLPWLGWVIVPVLALFLALQLLRWLVPAKSSTDDRARRGP